MQMFGGSDRSDLERSGCFPSLLRHVRDGPCCLSHLFPEMPKLHAALKTEGLTLAFHHAAERRAFAVNMLPIFASEIGTSWPTAAHLKCLAPGTASWTRHPQGVK